MVFNLGLDYLIILIQAFVYMLILAIESSCDETSIAVLDQSQVQSSQNSSFYERLNSVQALVNLISSQVDVHKEFGGVIPELGAREHAKNINQLFLLAIQKTAKKLNLTEKEVYQKFSKIVVTSQPGLVSALRVGIEFAKSLQFFLDKELNVKTELKLAHHLKGHIVSCFYHPFKNQNNLLDNQLFPHLHLLVSGGNTQLILLKNPTDWEIVGQTLDDAAGETLDKAGRMLGLDYPGGVWIAKIAGLDQENYFDFPVSMLNSPNLNFSYSGLKTAVRYFVQKQKFKNWKFEKRQNKDFLEKIIAQKNDLEKVFDSESLELAKFVYQASCSVQVVVVAQLIQKLKKGIKTYQPSSIGISGGVSANLLLRQEVNKIFPGKIFFPDKKLTGDNAVMIGLSGEL